MLTKPERRAWLVASPALLLALAAVVIASPASPASSGPPATALTSSDWSTRAQARIAASEYEASVPMGSSTLQAPNRSNGFRTWFAPSGVRVVPRDAGAAGWSWELALRGYGVGGLFTPVGQVEPAATGNRVEYRHGGLTEWYLNAPSGLEQGFTIAGLSDAAGPAPSGPRPLTLDLSLSGSLTPSLDGVGSTLILASPGGQAVLRYGQLSAADATGRTLPSSLSLGPAGDRPSIRITVDIRGAVFPVTIDPMTRGADWAAESNQAISWYGYAVKSAGDVNSDGYDDVIVGAYRYDAGETNEGRAFLYYGSPTGPSLTPDWTADGNSEGFLFGHDVGTAGDVNADGYGDVIIGAPNPDHNDKIGRAFIYFGSATGLGATADWSAQGGQTRGWFGRRVGWAGDVNGDGYDDVVVGMPHYHTDIPNVGRAFAFYGSPTGPSILADWIIDGDQGGALYGRSLGRAGDVNGDGYGDVIVGAHYYDDPERNEGRAYAYYGGPSGLDTSPAWIHESNQANAWFGRSVGAAGDVNADGYDDVIVGSPAYTDDQSKEGVAFAFYGSAAGLSDTPDWTGEAQQANAWFGRAVAWAGDVNADGYDDVVVGAPNMDTNQPDGGKVFCYFGSATGLSLTPDWTQGLNQANAWFGRAVATARDVNGDGYDDILVGAPRWTNPEDQEGGVWLFEGSPTGP
jgi:hypothetical protein